MAGFGGFGQTQPNTSFSFGITPAGTGAQTTATTTTLGTTGTPSFGFNTPKTTAGLSIGFGAATSQSGGGFTFGTSTTPSSITATSTPGTGLFVAPTSSTAPTFGVSTGTTTSLPSFGLGTSAVSTSTTPTLGLTLSGGSLFGSKPTTGLSLPSSTPQTSSGLGGVDNLQVKKGISGTGTVEPKAPKEQPLPEQLLQSLTQFQSFIKQQKSLGVEISHGNSKNLKKVQEDIDALRALMSTISYGLTQDVAAVDRLKVEAAKGLRQVEMAQRINDAPPGLSYDIYSTDEYFADLIERLETESARIQIQLENSEKHLKSLEESSMISPLELTRTMLRLHETLVVLAASAQTLHTSVQTQKEQYRNLRRIYCKDEPDLTPSKVETAKKYLTSLTGPTPFNDTPVPQYMNVLTNSSMNVSGWSTPFPTTASTLTSPQPVENIGLQLSKPVPGNKRNKR